VSRYPWGAGRAPALRCDGCGRQIGMGIGHHVIRDGAVLLCRHCRDPRTRAAMQEAHVRWYPACPHDWHDMFDHGGRFATRAGAWYALTDPENKRA